jgi:ubiquinone/menaquinone biosynthesis C-methylase UbiE
MSMEKRDFDKQAASWDEQPRRVKLADDIVKAISAQIELTPTMDVLDFGCGTGLITVRLQPAVGSVTGVDSSEGMLGVLKAKIETQQLSNVRALYCDLDKGDRPEGVFHLIAGSMTLHHIREIRPLINMFYGLTAPSGHLCIADLDLDDGRFHDDNEGVFHFGFDRSSLRRLFIEAGFDEVRDTTAAEVLKPDSTGNMNRFTVFLMTGRKKP